MKIIWLLLKKEYEFTFNIFDHFFRCPSDVIEGKKLILDSFCDKHSLKVILQARDLANVFLKANYYGFTYSKDKRPEKCNEYIEY